MPLLNLTGNGLTPTVDNFLYMLANLLLGISIGYYYGLKKAQKLSGKKVDMNAANAFSMISLFIFIAVTLAFVYPKN
jgi:hypothetical protein